MTQSVSTAAVAQTNDRCGRGVCCLHRCILSVAGTIFVHLLFGETRQAGGIEDSSVSFRVPSVSSEIALGRPSLGVTIPAASVPKLLFGSFELIAQGGFRSLEGAPCMHPTSHLPSTPLLKVYDEDSDMFVVAGHEGDDDFHNEFWKRILHSLCDAGYVCGTPYGGIV